MSPVYTRFFILALFSLLLEDCDSQEKTPKYISWDDDTLFDMEKHVYIDLKRKAQSVIYLKSKFKRHLSFYIGQSGFNLRKMYSQLMHMNDRNEKDKKKKSVEEMIKNATSCQRLAINIQLATESLQDYDKFAQEEENKRFETSETTGVTTQDYDYEDRRAGRRNYQASREIRNYLRSLDSADNTLRLRQLLDDRNEHRVTVPMRKSPPKFTNSTTKSQKHRNNFVTQKRGKNSNNSPG